MVWVFGVYKSFIMNIIKFWRGSIPLQRIHGGAFPFSKAGNSSRREPQRNENYHNSRLPVNKALEKEEMLKEAQRNSFDDSRDLRMVMLGSAMLTGALPFWAPLNAGLCLLNGGYIVSRVGHEFKRYLLLINNNRLEELSSFRPFQEYLKLVLSSSLMLAAQAMILTSGSYEVSSMFAILWTAIAIKQKVLPAPFYLTLVPLFVSIFFNIFADAIRSLVLGEAKQPKSEQQPQ